LLAAGLSEGEARKKSELFTKVERELSTDSGQEVARWFIPGRIEVLGKHTDYAGGRSLLCTAERGFCVVAVPRTDSLVRLTDVVRSQRFEFTISSELAVPPASWRLYVAVVARRLARNFPGALRGADIVLASDLPPAAGMSSSSALIIAIYCVLSTFNHIDEREEYSRNIEAPEDLASYLGCIENGQTYKSLTGESGVGTFGGSEDHTAILFSERRRLKQYSFAPVRLELSLQLPDICTFVIGVSGVVADKTGSVRDRYNRASQGVRTILALWRSRSGSDATTLAEAATSSPDSPDGIRAMLRQYASEAEDSAWLRNRFEHFWRESEGIVPHASNALFRNDLRKFGELVQESQFAAESLLRNQVPETCWLAKEARSLGAYAASAFGAGFGGSVWALVPLVEAAQFADRWRQAYERSVFRAAAHSEFFVTHAGPPLIRL
jgi:galactokinase